MNEEMCARLVIQGWMTLGYAVRACAKLIGRGWMGLDYAIRECLSKFPGVARITIG